jgi:hypothetical protein
VTGARVKGTVVSDLTQPTLFQRIKQALGWAPAPDRQGIQEAIEWVLNHSYPKIRSIRGHRKKLREPVAVALEFIDRLIAKLPEPLDITSAAARAFFVNADQVKQALSSDPDLQRFRSKNPADEFFTLLTMDRQVKTIYGSRSQGQIVIRDVALKAANFSDHTFRAPSATLADLKQTLKKGFLGILAHRSLENILDEQAREEELSQLKEEVGAKMQIIATQRRQMVLEWRSESDQQAYSQAQELLDTIEHELDTIQTRLRGANYYLEQLTRILNRPGDFVSAEEIAMHFDRTGILLHGLTPEGKHDIRLLELKLGDDLSRSCAVVKCSRRMFLD